MQDTLDPVDRRLLNEFQRDFPLVSRPFAVLAGALDIPEPQVIARIERHLKDGRIARLGATVRPNTAGASTLVAMQVPGPRIEEVAALVGAEPGVNHSYLREDDWNLWFVATAPDGAALDASLARIGEATGLQLLDLRLVRPFNIDLGFALDGSPSAARTRPDADLSALRDDDRPILHALSQGLRIEPKLWAGLAADLDRAEADVLDRIAALLEAGILTRLGLIVRHRAVGWSANAMVVWDVPEARMESAGRSLAAVPGVTLCYQRRLVPGLWRHGLFSMIHARSRFEANKVLESARALDALQGADHRVLFSTRCFKQTGARLAASGERAA